MRAGLLQKHAISVRVEAVIASERLGVRRGGVRNISTLRIQDHGNVGWDRLQREREDIHRGAAVTFEEGEVGLIRTYVRGRRTDDSPKESDGRLRSAAERFGDRRGFGIQTHTENAFVPALRRTELCEEGQLSRI